jgi:hypothetical protein
MNKTCAYLFKMLLIIVSSFSFTQIPSFNNQYYQQLVGHTEELSFQIKKLKLLAMQSGKTVEEYIEKFKSSPDVDFSRHGIFLEQMLTRFNKMVSARQAFDKVKNGLQFLWAIPHIDGEIFASTWKNYTFTLPLKADTLIWALMGAFFGYAIYLIIRYFFFVRKELEYPSSKN